MDSCLVSPGISHLGILKGLEVDLVHHAWVLRLHDVLASLTCFPQDAQKGSAAAFLPPLAATLAAL